MSGYRLVLTRTYDDPDDDTLHTEDYDNDPDEYTGGIDAAALTEICRGWMGTRESDDGVLPDGCYSVEAREIGTYDLVAESDGVEHPPPETAASQLGDALDGELVTALVAVGWTDLAELARPRIWDTATRIAAQLSSDDEHLAAQTVIDCAGHLWPADPEPEWWRTPLGRLVARSVGGEDASVTQAEAAAMLGVTRGTIAQLVSRGTLARHPDGGVDRAAVIARMLARSAPPRQPTCSYGSWYRNSGDSSATLLGQVEGALNGEFTDNEVSAVAAAYRAAINAALPDEVQLCGDEFYGPAFELDTAGYPVDEDGRLDIAAIIDGIDFWGIVDQLINPTI